MHVAIDTTPLTSLHSGRGVGAYTRLLLEALRQAKTRHTFSSFTPEQGVPKGVDLVHYPYFDPFFLTLPVYQKLPSVVTVHDLIPIAFPEQFPRGIRGELKWRRQRFALRRVQRVLTDSEASKKDVVRLAGMPENRITSVLLAPNPALSRVTSRTALASTRSSLGLAEKFFVYVGDLNWNKNVFGLIEAFSAVRRNHSDVHLVLVGSSFQRKDLAEARQVEQMIESMGLSRAVHRVGRLTDDVLSCVYSMALALVQPSFAEGFGLPVLEAFACGCPVVAATGSSLDEIAGPALRVNPTDTKSIADGMMQAMTFTGLARRDLITQGTAWVKEFTWEKAAKETIAVYEDVISHYSRL